jgi:hypothetical protein
MVERWDLQLVVQLAPLKVDLSAVTMVAKSGPQRAVMLAFQRVD